jgi:hypothetical protein
MTVRFGIALLAIAVFSNVALADDGVPPPMQNPWMTITIDDQGPLPSKGEVRVGWVCPADGGDPLDCAPTEKTYAFSDGHYMRLESCPALQDWIESPPFGLAFDQSEAGDVYGAMTTGATLYTVTIAAGPRGMSQGFKDSISDDQASAKQRYLSYGAEFIYVGKGQGAFGAWIKQTLALADNCRNYPSVIFDGVNIKPSPTE